MYMKYLIEKIGSNRCDQYEDKYGFLCILQTTVYRIYKGYTKNIQFTQDAKYYQT